MSSVLVTPGQLIDALITTNIKLSIQLNIAYDKKASLKEVGKAKRIICQLNAKRMKLVEEIDENFLMWLNGHDLYTYFSAGKNYGKDSITKSSDEG